MGQSPNGSKGLEVSRTLREGCRQARVTLPALIHDVHTFRRLGVEPTTARTR